jgi:GTP-binding protein HflX
MLTGSRCVRDALCEVVVLASSIDKVHGSLAGLRAQQRHNLALLYRRRVPPRAAISADVARAVAEVALDMGRPVSLLIDRRGRVVTVAAGDAADTPLPASVGEAEARLRGLRLVHIHVKPGGLSSADLTTLFLHRLDLIVAIDASYNERGDVVLGAAHLAMVAPPTADDEDWLIDPPCEVRTLERDDALQRIAALEEELARSWSSREVRRGSEERAVIVGLDVGQGAMETEARLDELAELVKSAGGTIAHRSLQKRPRVDPRTLVGKGKLEELISAAYHENAELLVFDRELTPAQARELARETTATNLKVLDRTQVILDIFAQNARGREAQVQVELAQLQYQLPRLSGRGRTMSRLGGGIGTRGPGETKLEVDRRRIRTRITALEAEVDALSKRRAETRKSRRRAEIPVIALVGYTNAGKSTLFNALAKSDALTRDALFATLRPTTREGWLPGLGAWGAKVVFTDTVGFIRDLPEELVNAFRATLEELHHADLLLHVVDAAAPGAPDRVEAVDRILDALELEVPRRVVLNKSDAAQGQVLRELRERYSAPACSAMSGAGLAELRATLAHWLGGGSGQAPFEEEPEATALR